MSFMIGQHCLTGKKTDHTHVMILFPFTKRQYPTGLSTANIRNRIEMNAGKQNWRNTFRTAASGMNAEDRNTRSHFTIMMGKEGLRYGKTSLLTSLCGTIRTAGSGARMLDITIQPLRKRAIFITGLYLFAAFCIYECCKNNNTTGIIVCILLITVTYISILLQFNREKTVYINFIEKEILHQ